MLGRNYTHTRAGEIAWLPIITLYITSVWWVWTHTVAFLSYFKAWWSIFIIFVYFSANIQQVERGSIVADSDCDLLTLTVLFLQFCDITLGCCCGDDGGSGNYRPPSFWNIVFMTTSFEAYLPSNLLYKPHQIANLEYFSSRLAVVFGQSTEGRCEVQNGDVVGAAPTDDAPTTSEWSTI